MSDKSRNGENTKNIRENSLNSLSNKIFADGLSSPECAKIFFNCLKQMESDVKKLFELHETSKNAKTKVTESLEHLPENENDMEKK